MKAFFKNLWADKAAFAHAATVALNAIQVAFIQDPAISAGILILTGGASVAYSRKS